MLVLLGPMSWSRLTQHGALWLCAWLRVRAALLALEPASRARHQGLFAWSLGFRESFERSSVHPDVKEIACVQRKNFGEQVVLKDSFESQTQTMSGQPAGKFGSK